MFKQMPDQGNIAQERDFDGVITLRRLINTTQDDRPAILNTDFGAQILSIDGVTLLGLHAHTVFINGNQ